MLIYLRKSKEIRKKTNRKRVMSSVKIIGSEKSGLKVPNMNIADTESVEGDHVLDLNPVAEKGETNDLFWDVLKA